MRLMSGAQGVFLAAAFVLVLGIAVLAQWGWLPRGKSKTVIVFVAGVATIVCLRLAELPPSWFDGAKTGFALAFTLMISSILGKTEDERSFGLPLLLGLGLTLFVANVVELIRHHV